jgi:hypothetical protein
VKEERRDLPRESFKEVANVVAESGIGTVATDSARPEGLRYYLGDELIVAPGTVLEPLLCEPAQEVVLVQHHGFPSSPGWDPAALDCLARKSVARVRAPQLKRGRSIDVWIIRRQASHESAGRDAHRP